MMNVEQDLAVWNEWYTLGAPEDMARRVKFATQLLGKQLLIDASNPENILVRSENRELPVKLHLGLLWTTLGQPDHDLFELKEYDEPGRFNLLAISTPLRASGQRLVESVMDPARFPFLHPGVLGREEHARLEPFGKTKVDDKGEYWSQGHFSWSPFTGDFEESEFRVLSPFSVLLHMRAPDDAEGNPRWNIIALFGQPVDEENVIAHKWYCWEGQDWLSARGKRSDAQSTAVQVKRAIVTHSPQKIPLYEGAECLIGTDSAIQGYRNWLKDTGIQYGTLFEPEAARIADDNWYPVAAKLDVPLGHLYTATIHGLDLMVWQDSGGKYHVWEDRCPHRGEKLSIGRHRGDKIQTTYQGWEFASNGYCCFVPAYPDAPLPDAPVKQHAHAVRDGLIWVRLAGEQDIGESLIADQPISNGLVLRPITVNAGLDAVKRQLPNDQGVAFALRPVNESKTVIYGVADNTGGDRITRLQQFNEQLSRLRDVVETAA